MSHDMMFQVLLRWNLWGKKVSSYSPRMIMREVENLFDYHGALVFQGPRRAGKSTLMMMIMTHLAKKWAYEEMLYINFEDYSLAAVDQSPQLIDQLIQAYRQRVHPQEPSAIFLDEIQNVKDWHRWVRTYVDLHPDRPLFLSGSSTNLMHSQLAGLLTGRHICLEVMPFSFQEWMWSLDTPTSLLEREHTKPSIQYHLREYMRHGGFPEVVLRFREDDIGRDKILSQYAQDVLMKDIAAMHNLLHPRILQFITMFIAQNIGSRISLRSLQKMIQSEFSERSSVTTISNYIQLLMETFLVFEVPFFHDSLKQQIRKPSKYYLCDPGLRNALYRTPKEDRGKLLENVVYLHLRRMYRSLAYWDGEREIDFVCIKDHHLDLYNVTWAETKDQIHPREWEGFSRFPKTSKIDRCVLITWDVEDVIDISGRSIELIPAWKFLLSL